MRQSLREKKGELKSKSIHCMILPSTVVSSRHKKDPELVREEPVDKICLDFIERNEVVRAHLFVRQKAKIFLIKPTLLLLIKLHKYCRASH